MVADPPEESARTRVLRTYPMGAVLRADDPLADRGSLRLRDLDDRQWFQLPEGTDPIWRAYWNCPQVGSELRAGPVVRTVQECMQAVLWNGTIGVAPLAHELPAGLTAVPLADMPPSRLGRLEQRLRQRADPFFHPHRRGHLPPGIAAAR